MTFAPPFQRVFSATFDRRAAAAAAVSWWLSGGVAAANAVAVYQPKGAASLAASYSNLANPGTYDAAPGVAPTWASGTGWTFNGTNQYLTTGAIPQTTWSIFLRFSDSTIGTTGVPIGEAPASGNTQIMLSPKTGGLNRYYWNGNTTGAPVAPPITSGVMAISGNNGYLNGSFDIAIPVTWSGTNTLPIYIGAANVNSVATYFTPLKIQAVAIYNSTLTAPQVLAISTAMAAL